MMSSPRRKEPADEVARGAEHLVQVTEPGASVPLSVSTVGEPPQSDCQQEGEGVPTRSSDLPQTPPCESEPGMLSILLGFIPVLGRGVWLAVPTQGRAWVLSARPDSDFGGSGAAPVGLAAWARKGARFSSVFLDKACLLRAAALNADRARGQPQHLLNA